MPDALANLYDFTNSQDLRRFTDHGVRHRPADELRSADELGAWMSERGLLARGVVPDAATLETALSLRDALRAYLACDPEGRRSDDGMLSTLDVVLRQFPLIVGAPDGAIELRPARQDARSGLAFIVAEFYDAARDGTLDRLKMCAAEECRRLFYDRSKPGTRRWCQASLCGNRMKTRNYRERHRHEH